MEKRKDLGKWKASHCGTWLLPEPDLQQTEGRAATPLGSLAKSSKYRSEHKGVCDFFQKKTLLINFLERGEGGRKRGRETSVTKPAT